MRPEIEESPSHLLLTTFLYLHITHQAHANEHLYYSFVDYPNLSSKNSISGELKQLLATFVSPRFYPLPLLTSHVCQMHISTEAIVAIVSLLVASPCIAVVLWKSFHHRRGSLRSRNLHGISLRQHTYLARLLTEHLRTGRRSKPIPIVS